MSSIPNLVLDTEEGAWLKKLNAQVAADAIESHCSFSTDDEIALQELQRRISETSPAEKAKHFKIKKVILIASLVIFRFISILYLMKTVKNQYT